MTDLVKNYKIEPLNSERGTMNKESVASDQCYLCPEAKRLPMSWNNRRNWERGTRKSELGRRNSTLIELRTSALIRVD